LAFPILVNEAHILEYYRYNKFPIKISSQKAYF